MGQHVLPVTRAVVEPPEELRALRVEGADVRLQHGLLADLEEGLLLDLTDEPGAVGAELVLELAEQDLARLCLAEVRDPLELAQMLALGGLQLLGLGVEVAGAVGEAAFLAGRVLEADLER